MGWMAARLRPRPTPDWLGRRISPAPRFGMNGSERPEVPAGRAGRRLATGARRRRRPAGGAGGRRREAGAGGRGRERNAAAAARAPSPPPAPAAARTINSRARGDARAGAAAPAPFCPGRQALARRPAGTPRAPPLPGLADPRTSAGRWSE